MNAPAQNVLDGTASLALVSVPWWWNAVNAYGQLLLLVIGCAVGLLRGLVLLKEYRRKE